MCSVWHMWIYNPLFTNELTYYELCMYLQHTRTQCYTCWYMVITYPLLTICIDYIYDDCNNFRLKMALTYIDPDLQLTNWCLIYFCKHILPNENCFSIAVFKRKQILSTLFSLHIMYVGRPITFQVEEQPCREGKVWDVKKGWRISGIPKALCLHAYV